MTVRCTTIRVRPRNTVLRGHSLAFSEAVKELGAHEVIALLLALAAELDCSGKCAVCPCRKDFSPLRIPTIRKDIDEHEPARPCVSCDTLYRKSGCRGGLDYTLTGGGEDLNSRAGVGRRAVSKVAPFVNRDVLMQVWIGHLQPERIVGGQLWLDHRAHPVGSIVHAAIQGDVSKVAIADCGGIGCFAGLILVAEVVLVSDLPLAECRMKVVPEDCIVCEDVALRRKAAVEISHDGLHVWPKDSPVHFPGIPIPPQCDRQRGHASAARESEKPAGYSTDQPEQALHRGRG